MKHLRPRGCIETRPQKHSVLLGGVYISLSAISRSQKLDLAGVSRIVSGKQTPSFQYAQKIATALLIGIDDLIYWIELRKVA